MGIYRGVKMTKAAQQMVDRDEMVAYLEESAVKTCPNFGTMDLVHNTNEADLSDLSSAWIDQICIRTEGSKQQLMEAFSKFVDLRTPAVFNQIKEDMELAK